MVMDNMTGYVVVGAYNAGKKPVAVFTTEPAADSYVRTMNSAALGIEFTVVPAPFLPEG